VYQYIELFDTKKGAFPTLVSSSGRFYVLVNLMSVVIHMKKDGTQVHPILVGTPLICYRNGSSSYDVTSANQELINND